MTKCFQKQKILKIKKHLDIKKFINWLVIKVSDNLKNQENTH